MVKSDHQPLSYLLGAAKDMASSCIRRPNQIMDEQRSAVVSRQEVRDGRLALRGYRGGLQAILYTRSKELSVLDGCLLWGARVVSPPPGRGMVLEELHETHMGMSKMKALA